MAAGVDPRYPRAVIPRRLFFLVVLALVVLPACGRYATTFAAVVEGQPITFAELDRQVQSLAASQGVQRVTDDIRPRLRRQALVNLIQRALVRDQVKRSKITVPDAQVDQRLAQIRARFADEEQFRQALQGQGFTESSLRDGLLEQLGFEALAAKIVPVTITDDTVRQAYDDKKADYEQVHARHILFSVQRQSPEEALAKARDALAKVRSGTDFATLAKQVSDDDASKTAGGDLGTRPRSFFDADFAKAAFSLPLKKVSDPVRTQFGYHLIEVLERSTIPLAQVREQIRGQLQQEARQAGLTSFIQKIAADADIDVNPRIGDFDPKTLQILEHQFFSPAPPERKPAPGFGFPQPAQ